MSLSSLVYVATAAALFGMGVYGLLVSSHLMRKLLSLNLLGTAVFLMIVASSKGASDPVPQAMVLTGIVITVAATAFALTLMLALARRTGRVDLDETTEQAPAGEAGAGD